MTNLTLLYKKYGAHNMLKSQEFLDYIPYPICNNGKKYRFNNQNINFDILSISNENFQEFGYRKLNKNPTLSKINFELKKDFIKIILKEQFQLFKKYSITEFDNNLIEDLYDLILEDFYYLKLKVKNTLNILKKEENIIEYKKSFGISESSFFEIINFNFKVGNLIYNCMFFELNNKYNIIINNYNNSTLISENTMNELNVNYINYLKRKIYFNLWKDIAEKELKDKISIDDFYNKYFDLLKIIFY